MISLILAISIHLHWFNRDSCTVCTYQGMRSFDGRYESMQPAFLWEDSLRTKPKLARGFGPDSGWCYLDDDPKSPLRYHILLLRGIVSSEPSNDIIATHSTADTTSFLQRPTLGVLVFTEPRMPKNGVYYWNLAEGDTLPVFIINQEGVQRALETKIRELYGYWVLWGMRIP